MWAGLTSSVSRSGLKLKDNGVCLVDEESILFAISEGRLSRNKHDSGAGRSLSAALSYAGIEAEDIVGIGVSSCTDAPWSANNVPNDLEASQVKNVKSHHYSHALSSYTLSPFDVSLVLVMDAGGNVFGRMDDDKWWSYPRTQHSLWVGIDGQLHLLERPFYSPYSTGFGEWYRAFTHYIGWKSHTKSGNTMALSSFGESSKICNEPLWSISRRSNSEVFHNDPTDPVGMVTALLDYIGSDKIQPRESGEILLPHHENVAAYIQDSVVHEALRFVDDKVSEYGIDQLCLSGGVSQNVIMNTKLANKLGHDSIYVSPFSGDVGQCVGNALSARARDVNSPLPGQLSNTFLGPTYRPSDLTEALSEFDYQVQKLSEAQLADRAARSLASDEVVAIYRGRSEFGPRALCHRSVLGSSQSKNVVSRIKIGVKQRQEFMPLAPVIHKSLAQEIRPRRKLSSTMVFAPKIPNEHLDEFGYATHVDNTARLQVANGDLLISDILEIFEDIEGSRVLINTSFNSRGEPIAETPKDALKSFHHLDIDKMIYGNMLVIK